MQHTTTVTEKTLAESIQNNEFFKMVAKHLPEGNWTFTHCDDTHCKDKEPPKRFQFSYEERVYYNWFFEEYGDDIEAADEEGNTLLHWEARRWRNVENVRHLISNGANVNAKNNRGDTPLHFVLYGLYRIIHEFAEGMDEGNTQRMIQERMGVIKCLVSAGADIYAQNKSGHSPLERAKAIGNTEVLECLMSRRT